MINRKTLVSARAIGGLVFAGTIVLSSAPPLAAQNYGLDARWQAWLGCWQASESEAYGRSPLVCVIPAGSASPGVNVITVADGKEISREKFQATGEKAPVARDGCNGWETAQWSSDNRRVYLATDLTCAGGLKRSSTGLIAMSGEGEWIDIKDIAEGGGSGLWGIRYRDAGTPAGLPAEIANALAGSRLAVATARAVAGAPINSADVIDASRHLEPGIVQGWLVARGQAIKLDANRIAALADRGVPGSVTDVMLALEYPKLFSLDAGPFGVQSSRSSGMADEYPQYGRASNVYTDRYGYDAAGYGSSSYGYSRYGYSPYGYSAYGYSPYGYSPYGYGYGGRAPYIIVTRGSPVAPRGQAVNGRGYTRGNDANGSGRTSVSRPRTSSGSSGSSGSQPASSGGRTAKPRH